MTQHFEGKVKFEVGGAFYNPQGQIVRDLGVLAAGVHRAEVGQLRVLEAMAGCGVRSLRYWRESQGDWLLVNEGNPNLGEILKGNLAPAIAAQKCEIVHQEANRLFFECYNRRDYYDLVDVDGFGSPAPYLNTALRGTKIGGLLYLTSTDGRTAMGHLPEKSLRVYGAYARAHPAAHEQGLRLALGSVQQQAATMGLGIEPIFSFFFGQSYRVMVRLIATPCLNSSNYGFLGYCHRCGEYQTVSWRSLGRVLCLKDNAPLTLSGPLWLGNLHDRGFLGKMQTLARQWNWPQRVQLLELMANEADFPPYFYTLGEIGRRGKLDIPPRSHLLQELQDSGYQASPTHLNPQAIKTNANLETCIAIARRLVMGH